MRWQDKLTKKELKHFREMGITTLKQAAVNAHHQKEERKLRPCEPCWECRFINHKLGLPV